MQAELFKVRDKNNVVIGVASRLASASSESGSFIEWSVHLPARGTMYVKMEITPSADGFRSGELLVGTRDFATLSGSVRELFISDISDADDLGDESDVQARIKLEATLVGRLGDTL